MVTHAWHIGAPRGLWSLHGDVSDLLNSVIVYIEVFMAL